MTSEDGWLKVKLDRAESNRDTWVCREVLTDANKDIQWSNLEIKVPTRIDVIQVTDANLCSEAERLRSPVLVIRKNFPVKFCT
jgi:hypothetical protein